MADSLSRGHDSDAGHSQDDSYHHMGNTAMRDAESPHVRLFREHKDRRSRQTRREETEAEWMKHSYKPNVAKSKASGPRVGRFQSSSSLRCNDDSHGSQVEHATMSLAAAAAAAMSDQPIVTSHYVPEPEFANASLEEWPFEENGNFDVMEGTGLANAASSGLATFAPGRGHDFLSSDELAGEQEFQEQWEERSVERPTDLHFSSQDIKFSQVSVGFSTPAVDFLSHHADFSDHNADFSSQDMDFPPHDDDCGDDGSQPLNDFYPAQNVPFSAPPSGGLASAASNACLANLAAGRNFEAEPFHEEEEEEEEYVDQEFETSCEERSVDKPAVSANFLPEDDHSLDQDTDFPHQNVESSSQMFDPSPQIVEISQKNIEFSPTAGKRFDEGEMRFLSSDRRTNTDSIPEISPEPAIFGTLSGTPPRTTSHPLDRQRGVAAEEPLSPRHHGSSGLVLGEPSAQEAVPFGAAPVAHFSSGSVLAETSQEPTARYSPALQLRPSFTQSTGLLASPSHRKGAAELTMQEPHLQSSGILIAEPTPQEVAPFAPTPRHSNFVGEPTAQEATPVIPANHYSSGLLLAESTAQEAAPPFSAPHHTSGPLLAETTQELPPVAATPRHPTGLQLHPSHSMSKSVLPSASVGPSTGLRRGSSAVFPALSSHQSLGPPAASVSCGDNNSGSMPSVGSHSGFPTKQLSKSESSAAVISTLSSHPCLPTPRAQKMCSPSRVPSTPSVASRTTPPQTANMTMGSVLVAAWPRGTTRPVVVEPAARAAPVDSTVRQMPVESANRTKPMEPTTRPASQTTPTASPGGSLGAPASRQMPAVSSFGGTATPAFPKQTDRWLPSHISSTSSISPRFSCKRG